MIVELFSDIFVSTWTVIREAKTKMSHFFRVFFATFYSTMKYPEQIVIFKDLIWKLSRHI